MARGNLMAQSTQARAAGLAPEESRGGAEKKATKRQTRDPEATRRRLLEAAKREFASKGLEGARVHAIATRARTNKQLVYHYFKSKDHLYTMVLEEAYASFRGREDIDRIQALEPEEAIRALVELLFSSFRELRQEVALIGDENMHRARHIRGSEKIKELHRPVIALMADIIRRGEQKGVIRGKIDPVRLFVFLLSITNVYVSNNYTLSAVFERDLSDPTEVTAWRSFVTELAVRAIRP